MVRAFSAAWEPSPSSLLTSKGIYRGIDFFPTLSFTGELSAETSFRFALTRSVTLPTGFDCTLRDNSSVNDGGLSKRNPLIIASKTCRFIPRRRRSSETVKRGSFTPDSHFWRRESLMPSARANSSWLRPSFFRAAQRSWLISLNLGNRRPQSCDLHKGVKSFCNLSF